MIERRTRASLRRGAWLWQAGACFAVLLDVELARGESVQRPYVSLDATLLSLDSATVDSPSELDAEAGTDLEVDETTSTFGLLGSGVGVGAGVGVSDNVVLGGQLRITSQTVKADDETTFEASSLTLLPRIEYVFSTGTAARPFLVGFFGLSNVRSELGEIETRESRTLFGVGLGGHLFATPSFSIDPLLTVARYGGTRTTTIPELGELFESDEFEFDVSGTLVLVTVSVTGWFGDTTAPPKATLEAAPPDAGSLAAPAPPVEEEMSGPAPVKTNLLLADDRVLLVKGRPESLRSAVMFRMSNAPGEESLATCRDVTIVSGDARFAARNLQLLGKRTIGNEQRNLAEGLFKVEAFDALMRDREAAIVVCGERWALTDAAREGLTTFLAEFRRRGGLPAKKPEPTQPSQPIDAPATDAPSQPPAEPPPTPLPPQPPAVPPKGTFE